MRTRTALIISLGGTLAAASASAVVHGASSARPEAVTVAQVSTSSSPPAPSTSIGSSVPSGTTVVPTPVPGAPTQLQFAVGPAAMLTVDTANEVLRVVMIAPNPGWQLEEFELDDDGDLELRLSAAAEQVRFEAEILDGAIVATLRSADDGTSSTVANSVPTPSTGDTASTVATTPGGGSTVTTLDDDRDDRDDDSGGSGRGDDDDDDDDRGDDGRDDDADDDGDDGDNSGRGSDDD